MAKQGAKTAVPRLRFPEFRQADAWTENSLKDICIVNPPNDGLPDSFVYIDLESVEGGVLKSKNRIEKKSAPSRAQRVLRNGDVIFQAVRPYQRNNLFIEFHDGDAYVASTGYAQLRAQNSKAFLYQIIHTDPFVEKVIAKCTGSNYPAINSTDLADVLLFAPEDVDEQQKIADCLTSLDEVIAAQGRKVEALKAHKRGLMQQLFPREGETRPRLRFPEFRNALEWSSTLLGEATVIVRGGSPRPIDAYLTRERNGLNWLKIGDVDREAKYVTETEVKVRPEALAKTRMIHAGDFILSNSMSFGRPYIATIDTCIHDGWIAVTEIPQALSCEFLYYSILSDKSQRYFANQAAGSGVQNLNKDIIKLLPLEIPSKEEQQIVANCLSSLDVQIAQESSQLATLKTHKQGLMQQLFPVPEGG